MKIILIDGFDWDFLNKIPYLHEVMEKSISAKVRCLPNAEIYEVLKECNNLKVDFIHMKHLDYLAHNCPEKLDEYLNFLNRKIKKMKKINEEFIICSDHGNQELGEHDKVWNKIAYGHDYFVTYTPFIYHSHKQSPKDLGEISAVEMERYIKMVVNKVE